jgi:hypothetical protein
MNAEECENRSFFLFTIIIKTFLNLLNNVRVLKIYGLIL